MFVPIIHRFGTVSSTNDIAIAMARRGEPEGTVVTALAQSSGRGRRGHTWWDHPGRNVLMSMVLRPDKPVSCLGEMAFVVSLGVAEYIAREHGLEPGLKWPNDVMIGSRKIVGILVEAVPSQEGCVVAGIGLNVNQPKFPSELAGIATSLAIESGRFYDVDSIADGIAASVLEIHRDYLKNGFEETLGLWRKYMWGVGKQACIMTGDQEVIGIIDGVNCSGALVLRDSSGNTIVVHAADNINSNGGWE
ncbi:MAG: biotin--[acetyl-CoA-carboxylase] ligase [Armatimonadota bacterium]|nr:biotin--[acetyl-CoA-carboxylase] ligase [bacterium]